jgi:hypothetical protein
VLSKHLKNHNNHYFEDKHKGANTGADFPNFEKLSLQNIFIKNKKEKLIKNL